MKLYALKPSALIRLALDDLRKVQTDPRYRITMSDWHTAGDQTCSVCLAGAVMAQSLGGSRQRDLFPHHFEKNRKAFYAIDAFRVGNIRLAFYHLGIKDGEELLSRWKVPRFDEADPAPFFIAVGEMAAYLEEKGF